MSVLNKGSFSLNLGIMQLSAELSDDDRQCAWELYTELSTRVAVTGKIQDSEFPDFDGELYIESLESLHKFFLEARTIMRKFPVGKIRGDNKNHLGVMIHRVLNDVLRPFLEKWQSKYRHWWESQSNPRLAPLPRQQEFGELKEFLDDWSAVRWLMKEVQKELVAIYQLVDVDGKR